jgi:hypothetical protein
MFDLSSTLFVPETSQEIFAMKKEKNPQNEMSFYE